jgi:glycosyltransferase involved in cell wall biosynthesis
MPGKRKAISMKVSVVTVVYNQERYIAQTLESALMQLGNFDIEIIVGDDCSIDGTRAIVSDFASRFPGRIRKIFRETHVGGALNFQKAYESADGDYIALLEGDDFWTDPLKLAKQIAFLERRRDCSMCFHDTVLFYNDGSMKPHLFNMGKQKRDAYSLDDLLDGNFIQTCSVVYRGKIVARIPEWLNGLPMGDWPLHLLHAAHGAIGYIDEPMGVYRQHGNSMWASSGLPERIRRSIKAAGMIDAALDLRYHEALSATMTRWSNDLVNAYLRDTKPDQAILAIDEALAAAPPAKFVPYLANAFAAWIIGVVEQGRGPEAVACFERHAGKFSSIEGMARLGEAMERLKISLNVPQ